jgi:hypothetical protein
VYQLRIWIRKISPQIWRRLLVRSDSTIAKLHDILQIVFGWSDEHLHRFLIRGKPYGIGRIGGIIFDDNPRQIQLRDFHFRLKETWLCKDGSFEMIVGKSTTEEGATTRFGLVSSYDPKPRRRLFEVLQGQGLQMNQAISFLTDGGDTLRDLTEGHSPLAVHILDWFHITMRITVLNQMAKGVGVEQRGEKFEEELERVKWFLWHSNVYKALQLLEWLDQDIDAEASPEAGKLARTLYELDHYIRANQSSIPNYNDRYRNGEPISSALAESSVNQIISKRFVKKQQMRWTWRGAHLLAQVRTRVLNDTLTATFQRWYPGMEASASQQEPVLVAS